MSLMTFPKGSAMAFVAVEFHLKWNVKMNVKVLVWAGQLRNRKRFIRTEEISRQNLTVSHTTNGIQLTIINWWSEAASSQILPKFPCADTAMLALHCMLQGSLAAGKCVWDKETFLPLPQGEPQPLLWVNLELL